MSEPLQFVARWGGKVLLTVGEDGIASALWPPAHRIIAFADIAAIDVQARRGALLLHLERKDGGKPVDFPLHRLAPPERERLVGLLQQRLGVAAPNPLAQEREFAQRLRALAPRTWITWAIVALNIAAWLATVAAGADPLQPGAAQLLALGANSAYAVQHGQWWRLLTAAFLHIGLLHLAMNMLGLLLLGPTVERIYGHGPFLLLYLGCALAGGAASLHFSAQGGVSVGASGAVFGVAGALLTAVFHHRRRLPLLFGKRTLGGIGFFIVYSLVQGMAPGVDNAAHIGGLAAGVALAFILPERFSSRPDRRGSVLRAALASVFVVGFTAAIALTASRAPLDLGAALAANPAVEHGLLELTSAVRELQREAREVKAGRLGEIEADDRSRRVHAPRFRALVQELSAISLPPNDPREPVLATARRMAELLLELMAMDSRIVDGKPVSVDPVRWAAITAELDTLNRRLTALAAQAKQRR
jgi:rhomboid protease GluP